MELLTFFFVRFAHVSLCALVATSVLNRGPKRQCCLRPRRFIVLPYSEVCWAGTQKRKLCDYVSRTGWVTGRFVILAGCRMLAMPATKSLGRAEWAGKMTHAGPSCKSLWSLVIPALVLMFLFLVRERRPERGVANFWVLLFVTLHLQFSFFTEKLNESRVFNVARALPFFFFLYRHQLSWLGRSSSFVLAFFPRLHPNLVFVD